MHGWLVKEILWEDKQPKMQDGPYLDDCRSLIETINFYTLDGHKLSVKHLTGLKWCMPMSAQ